MLVFLLPLELDVGEGIISPLDMVASVTRYCKAHEVKKIFIERPSIISTRSRSSKPLAQVNVDAFKELMTVRGVCTITFTPTFLTPETLGSFLDVREQQIKDIIDVAAHQGESILVIASPEHIGVDVEKADRRKGSTFVPDLIVKGYKPYYINGDNL